MAGIIGLTGFKIYHREFTSKLYSISINANSVGTVVGVYVYNDANGNKYIQPLLSNSDENGKFVVANEAGFNIGSHLFIMYAVY